MPPLLAMRHANLFLVCSLFLPSASARAQSLTDFSFSIDYHGPTRSAPDCSTGLSLSEGDILQPCGGTPVMPVVPGPLPKPRVFLSAGPGGLGLPGYVPCFGLPPGAPCSVGVEVDALSFGVDDLVDPNIQIPGTLFTQKATYRFSVDEFAVGQGFPFPPAVRDEATVGDSGADVFTDVGFGVAPPLPPFGGFQSGNVADVDGDGRPQFPTYWAYPGTGLVEPSAPGLPPDPGDNLDALDVDTASVPPGSGLFPVFYSLDSALIDPRNGLAGGGTAANMGFSGADVLWTVAAGGTPSLFAPANLLGLDLAGGPDSDDLDALILWENGSGAFEPSRLPYDWFPAPASTDMLFFSVRVGSAVVGLPDSRYGIPIEPGDILAPPLPVNFGGLSPYPSIWIAAENLGLEVSVARGSTAAFGDDLDALDHSFQKALLHHEYCFGDGGLAGCTACPCGNDMPQGSQTGCLNSTGTGARLWVSGLACITNDTLRFQVSGAAPSTFAVLNTAANRLPLSGPCPPGSGIAPLAFDGLRCIGGQFQRLPARATDANGDVGFSNAGWGLPSGPLQGVLNYAGYLSPCLPTQWQVFYRENPAAGCNTGLSTTQAVQVLTTP